MHSKYTKWTKRLPFFSILQTNYVISYGKDREKDKCFEFYFDYVFVIKSQSSLQNAALQASEKPQNLTVDLSADNGTVFK